VTGNASSVGAVIAPQAKKVVIANPKQVRIIAHAKIKTDTIWVRSTPSMPDRAARTSKAGALTCFVRTRALDRGFAGLFTSSIKARHRWFPFPIAFGDLRLIAIESPEMAQGENVLVTVVAR
jgi:hypothetical protein